MVLKKVELNSLRSLAPALSCEPQKVCDQTRANGRKRQVLNQTHEAAQSMSQDLKDFEREFWILQANSFEIISRKSENDDIAGGLRARRISATVKDRYFSERISSPFYADQLLSSVRGRLDDLYGPCLDDQKFMARVALRKNRGSSFISQTAHVFCDHSEFRIGQVCEERQPAESTNQIRFRWRHWPPILEGGGNPAKTSARTKTINNQTSTINNLISAPW